ncbi:MAG: DUF1707 domain-containing protein [Terracoccus sp.]
MDIEQIRVSSTDREQALADLKTHFEAGRLHSFEYEDRRGRAGDATVRSELDALFGDLPRVDAAPVTDSSPASSDRHADTAGGRRRGRCVSYGAAYSWVPLLAAALFFISSSWVWFLMIPAAGYIARSGAGSRPDNHRVRS